MTHDAALETYIVESQELLEQMEQGLLACSEGDADSETINAIFRAAHTIKGSAGLFGLDDIVAFTHKVESVLDQVRDGTTPMDAALVTLLLQCRDHMSRLIEALATATTPPPEIQAAGDAMQARLATYLGASAAHAEAAAVAASVPAAAADAGYWHLSLRFGRDVFRNGMDPLSFIRYLSKLGEVVCVTAYACEMPPTDEVDAESCYLGFEVGLRGSTDKASIESAFEFVRDDCQLTILPPHSKAGDYRALVVTAAKHGLDLAPTLLQHGATTEADLDDAPPAPVAGQAAEAQPSTGSRPVEVLKQPKDQKPQEARFIRLDAEKLDSLINLVGELVIAGAGIGMASKRIGDGDLLEAASTLATLVEEVRDSALQLRMVQIGATFNRFQRVVHDVSAELGKDIALSVSGAETELDKTLVERIGDPLMHLVRNAMDHGIEPTSVRIEQGKPAKGLVRLNAFHDAGSVVIEVGDDGGGLNRERILAKARERGLVSEDQTLSDKEVWNIIFEPGFSTASQISNLSGRGVGMDVVKRSINDLRGTVEVESHAGTGTTIRIRLPLTLAIIDGFMVGVGKSVFVVPLDMVEECVELTAAAREETRGRDYINLRGKVLPFIVARELFGIEDIQGRRQNILVLRYAGQRAGLVVDDLMGEAQTVIKPLGKLFQAVQGICGSTILGDGRVALILDVPSLLEGVQQSASTQFSLKTAA